MRGEASVGENLALYMVESEQRPAEFLTSVVVQGGVCVRAMGLMVESLPGSREENVDNVIRNLASINKKGFEWYVKKHADVLSAVAAAQTEEPADVSSAQLTSFTGDALSEAQILRGQELLEDLSQDSVLDMLLDDCLAVRQGATVGEVVGKGGSDSDVDGNLGNSEVIGTTIGSDISGPGLITGAETTSSAVDTQSIRWSKKPRFRCTCSEARVWRALRLLDKSEISDMVATGEGAKVRIKNMSRVFAKKSLLMMYTFPTGSILLFIDARTYVSIVVWSC
jgi:hypothetical protein